MKYSRFLCIVLCLILLVSISPIQAHAAATGIVIGGMTVTELILNGALGVTAILGALGLAKDINYQTGAWDNLVASVTGFLTDAGIIQDDNMTVQQAENGQLFVGADVIQSVKDWLFSSNTIQSVDLTCSISYSCPWYRLVSMSTEFTIQSSSPTVPVAVICQYEHPTAGAYFYSSVFLLSSSNFTASYGNSAVPSSWIKPFSNGYYCNFSSTTSSVSSYECYYPDSLALLPCFKFVFDGSLPSDTDIINMLPALDSVSCAFPDGISISSCPPQVDTDISVNYTDWYNLALQANGYDPDNPPHDKDLHYWPLSFSRDTAELDGSSQQQFWTGVDSSLSNIESGVDTTNMSLKEILSVLKDFFTTFPQKLEEFWKNLWQDISNLPQTLLQYVVEPIVQALKELFIPDASVISSAVETMMLKFPFFNSIIGTWRSFQLRLSGSPPVVYAHLQNAEGQFNWGGTVAVLDMRFYERYKSIGDAVLSAALWCFFGWRMFVKLPGLISGAAGDIHSIERIDKH